MEKKMSYKYFVVDVEELNEEPAIKRPYMEQQDSVNRVKPHFGNIGSETELCGAESPTILPFYPLCASQDRWAEKDDKDIQDNMQHLCCTAEGSIGQEYQISMLQYSISPDEQHSMADCPLNGPVSPPETPVTHRPCLLIPVPGSVTTTASTISSVVHPTGSRPGTGSDWNTLRSISSSSGCCDGDPVCAAAHLHLLGESLSLIGHHLQETNKMVCMSSGLSLLLDSLLCALAPLICLTTQIPDLKSCTQDTLVTTLENIAYLMPGL